ncbi:hypothetical protein TNCV_4481491 [Trichonephila clavipes]|nr:hypothetical protein TNCV_4481491 [Trichonephila clavipes]
MHDRLERGRCCGLFWPLSGKERRRRQWSRTGKWRKMPVVLMSFIIVNRDNNTILPIHSITEFDWQIQTSDTRQHGDDKSPLNMDSQIICNQLKSQKQQPSGGRTFPGVAAGSTEHCTPKCVVQARWCTNTFQFWCVTNSMLRNPGGGMDSVVNFLSLHAPNLLDLFFWGRLKSRVYARGYSSGSSSFHLTAPAHQNNSNASNNPSSVNVGCAITYEATTSNNFSDNHFLLHF